VAHTDVVVADVEQYYSNLKAGLDWSVAEPAIGLRFLRLLGRPLLSTGRASDVLDAVDRLLTEENTHRHATEWVAAVYTVGPLVNLTRGIPAAWSLQEPAERLAASIGDAYGQAILTLLRTMSEDVGPALRDMVRQRQDRYMEGYAILVSPWVLAFHDPHRAEALVDTDEFEHASRASTSLGDFAEWDRAEIALQLGRLPACMELCARLLDSRSSYMAACGVGVLGVAALLAADVSQLERACEVADRRLLGDAGPRVRDLLEQLRGRFPADNPFERPDTDHMSPLEVHLAAREAIEAGHPDLALRAARERRGLEPYDRAVLALTEARVHHSEDRWHDALRIAAEYHLYLALADALEGLVIEPGARRAGRNAYASTARPSVCATNATTAGATHPSKPPSTKPPTPLVRNSPRSKPKPPKPKAATSAGPKLSNTPGEPAAKRKRPRHGWAALTPTESQVVDLVAQGLTNPQIAERLIMGRATVKTHLEHIFAKLGVTTRTELASEAVRPEFDTTARPDIDLGRGWRAQSSGESTGTASSELMATNLSRLVEAQQAVSPPCHVRGGPAQIGLQVHGHREDRVRLVLGVTSVRRRVRGPPPSQAARCPDGTGSQPWTLLASSGLSEPGLPTGRGERRQGRQERCKCRRPRSSRVREPRWPPGRYPFQGFEQARYR
jgi:DNA-binding CsgD family transcriptional regulator